MKVKVISLPYIFQVLYFTRPRHQVSVYRTIGTLVFLVHSGSLKRIDYLKKLSDPPSFF